MPELIQLSKQDKETLALIVESIKETTTLKVGEYEVVYDFNEKNSKVVYEGSLTPPEKGLIDKQGRKLGLININPKVLTGELEQIVGIILHQMIHALQWQELPQEEKAKKLESGNLCYHDKTFIELAVSVGLWIEGKGQTLRTGPTKDGLKNTLAYLKELGVPEQINLTGITLPKKDKGEQDKHVLICPKCLNKFNVSEKKAKDLPAMYCGCEESLGAEPQKMIMVTVEPGQDLAEALTQLLEAI
jgi:hypothetical protein